MNSKDSYLYPYAHYGGEVKPQNLVFNANLQEFSQRVGVICALQTGGKVTSAEAFGQIKQLWKSLNVAKRELLDNPAFRDPQDPSLAP